MATIIKGGSKVHAGLRAQSGAFVGGACRITGTASVVGKDRISMHTDPSAGGRGSGDWREFDRADVHHEQDCTL